MKKEPAESVQKLHDEKVPPVRGTQAQTDTLRGANAPRA